MLVVKHARDRVKLGERVAELGEEGSVIRLDQAVLTQQGPVLFIEAGLRNEVHAGEGGEIQPGNVVGPIVLQAARWRVVRYPVRIQRRRHAGISVRIDAGDMEALPHDCLVIKAAVGLQRVLHADIDAGPRLDAVVARETIDVEQEGVVKHQAPGVFIGCATLIDAVGTNDDLGRRLEHVRCPAGVGNKRIGVEDAARGHAAHDGVIRNELGRVRCVARVRPRIDVATQVAERCPHLTHRIDHLAAPVRFRHCECRVGAVRACHGARVRLEAQLAACNGIAPDVVVVDHGVYP